MAYQFAQGSGSPVSALPVAGVDRLKVTSYFRSKKVKCKICDSPL